MTAARVAAVAGCAVALLAGCGGDEDEPRPTTDPFTAVEQRERAASDAARRRAAPRWETVATLRGSGAAERSVEIADDAVQWKARWRCERGAMAVAADGRRLGRSSCPGRGDGESAERGEVALDVRADGPWRMIVQQQVTTALREPPLPEMEAPGARVLASGRFRPVERRGAGRVELHRLPDGRHALRFEGFATAANSDLFVWLSEARDPRTTRAALRAERRDIGPLTSTLGDQNYVLPGDVDVSRIRSIVIWCEPIRIAYASAVLRR